MKIILASNSPRRKELLKNEGFEFEVVPPVGDEYLDNDIFNSKKIEKLALNKAKSVNDNENIIIGADTVVVYNNKIYTKPKDFDNAVLMLKQLQGHTHFVVTAVALVYKDLAFNSTETTYVTFNQLSDDEIKEYINKFQPFDKAGAYGIQELPKNFVSSVDGEIDNVIGLPIKLVKKLLAQIVE